MKQEHVLQRLKVKRIVAGVSLAYSVFWTLGIPTLAAAEQLSDYAGQNRTATPIKHVIVIIG